jgi:hypothetical protein
MTLLKSDTRYWLLDIRKSSLRGRDTLGAAPSGLVFEGAGGRPNFYPYVRNNPTDLVDPFGLTPGTIPWPWPWKPIPIPIPWGRLVGPVVDVIEGIGAAGAAAITAVGELTVGAPVTARDEDMLKKDPQPCDRKDDPCYAQYLDDTAWCGEHITDDWDYDTCMGIAWENYERCKRGQPRIEPDPRKYPRPKSLGRKPND